ncbi:MAG TPA: hypothetical protein PLM98_01875, partial [Thiolinea sp.]|nr:hypothetical protein [Thiolinea sp.]
MSATDHEPIKNTKLAFLIPSHSQRSANAYTSKLALPQALATSSRATKASRNLFMSEAAVQVEQVFDLSQGGRSSSSEQTAAFATEQLMVLEAQDGSIVVMRADKLQEELQRLYPNSTKPGEPLNLKVLKERDSQT